MESGLRPARGEVLQNTFVRSRLEENRGPQGGVNGVVRVRAK